MSVDLSKLAPAPWEIMRDADGNWLISRPSGFPMLLPEDDDNAVDLAALEFAALARNAFDVMMRRDWAVGPVFASFGLHRSTKVDVEWGVQGAWVPPQLASRRWADPFSALVEADAWLKEQESAQ